MLQNVYRAHSSTWVRILETKTSRKETLALKKSYILGLAAHSDLALVLAAPALVPSAKTPTYFTALVPQLGEENFVTGLLGDPSFSVLPPLPPLPPVPPPPPPPVPPPPPPPPPMMINYIYGTSEADDLVGTIGVDMAFGDHGDDYIFLGLGHDTGFGDHGDDILDGWSGNDILYGGRGADTLYGWVGNDLLYGESGDDRLRGEDGHDTLDGGSGADRLYGDHGDDFLYGGTGNDRLYGGEGNDELLGESGDDRLEGGEGADYLDGGSGLNILMGDEGDDFLVVGDGDRASGGEGADQFRLVNNETGEPTIFEDFDRNADTVDLSMLEHLDPDDFVFDGNGNFSFANDDFGMAGSVVGLGVNSLEDLRDLGLGLDTYGGKGAPDEGQPVICYLQEAAPIFDEAARAQIGGFTPDDWLFAA